METGWVKMQRAVMNSPLMKDGDLMRLAAYGWIRAVSDPQWVQVTTGGGRKVIRLEPGQWLFGRDAVAERVGMAPSTCYRVLQRLVELKLASLEPHPHYTIVTMHEWSDEQAVDQPWTSCEQAVDQPRTSCEPAVDTYKNKENNETNENNQTTSCPSASDGLPKKEGNEDMSNESEQGAFLLEAPQQKKKPLPECLKPHKRIRWNPQEQRLDGIIREDLAQWEVAYPAVDLDLELRQAEVWLSVNPDRGKRRNYARFLTNWLSRSQERGGTRGSRSSSHQGALVIHDREARERQLREESAL